MHHGSPGVFDGHHRQPEDLHDDSVDPIKPQSCFFEQLQLEHPSPPFGGFVGPTVGPIPPPPDAGYAVAIADIGASPVGTLIFARPPETVMVGPVHPPSVGSPKIIS